MNDVLPALGCLGLLILGLPFWAIVVARRARKETAQLRASVAELSSARVNVLGRRSTTGVPGTPGASAPAAAPADSTAAGSASVPAPDLGPPPLAAAAFSAVSAESGPSSPSPAARGAFGAPGPVPPAPSSRPHPPPPTAPPTPPVAPRKPLDWESLISVRAFAWLGGAALFLAMGLFLQYSIQHNLIPPAVRVAIGLLVGAIALAGGDWLRSKADRAGQAMAGAGVAILYASLFAAHSLYRRCSARRRRSWAWP